MAKIQDLERRLTLVEQLLGYHHAEIEELWAQLSREDDCGDEPEDEMTEEVARFSVAAEMEVKESEEDCIECSMPPQASADDIDATIAVTRTEISAQTPPLSAPESTVQPESSTEPALSTLVDHASDATSPETQTIEEADEPAQLTPTPTFSRFAGQNLAEVLPTLCSNDAHDFAAEIISRHPVTNGGDPELAIDLLQAVVANLLEEAPAETHTMDTLRSMAAQSDEAQKATFDTLAQGLRYDITSRSWVQSNRADEHPAIAPWSKYIAAGELMRILAREAVENALKEE